MGGNLIPSLWKIQNRIKMKSLFEVEKFVKWFKTVSKEELKPRDIVSTSIEITSFVGWYSYIKESFESKTRKANLKSKGEKIYLQIEKNWYDLFSNFNYRLVWFFIRLWQNDSQRLNKNRAKGDKFHRFVPYFLCGFLHKWGTVPEPEYPILHTYSNGPSYWGKDLPEETQIPQRINESHTGNTEKPRPPKRNLGNFYYPRSQTLVMGLSQHKSQFLQRNVHINVIQIPSSSQENDPWSLILRIWALNFNYLLNLGDIDQPVGQSQKLSSHLLNSSSILMVIELLKEI